MQGTQLHPWSGKISLAAGGNSSPWVTTTEPALLCCAVLSRVWLFAAPWTVVGQTLLSMEILQVRILEWVVMLSSRGSSHPKDRTQVYRIAGGFSTVWATREDQTLEPQSCNYWAPTCCKYWSPEPKACVPLQEKRPQREAQALQRRAAPNSLQLGKPVSWNEDPAQPKIK